MGDQIKMRTFDRTAAAIVEFDAGRAMRELNWQRAETNEDVESAQTIDDLALREVQNAFHLDTQDINSVSHCRQVDIAFMRKCARGVKK